MGILGTKAPRGIPWTPERDEILKRLWTDLKTTTVEIADLIGGITKGAVVGRARRLNFPPRYPTRTSQARAGGQKTKAKMRRKRAPAPRPEIEPNPPGLPLPVIRRFNGDRVQPTKPAVQLPREAASAITVGDIPKRQRKTIWQLTEKTCRWPFGHPCESSFFYCGKAEADWPHRPYCRFHTLAAAMGSTAARREGGFYVSHRSQPVHSQRRDENGKTEGKQEQAGV